MPVAMKANVNVLDKIRRTFFPFPRCRGRRGGDDRGGKNGCHKCAVGAEKNGSMNFFRRGRSWNLENISPAPSLKVVSKGEKKITIRGKKNATSKKEM